MQDFFQIFGTWRPRKKWILRSWCFFKYSGHGDQEKKRILHSWWLRSKRPPSWPGGRVGPAYRA